MHPIATARGQVRDGKGAAADGVLSHCTQAKELCGARMVWRAVCVCVCASRGMWCVVERIDLSELHTQVCKAVPAGAVLRMNDVRMLTTVNLVQH